MVWLGGSVVAPLILSADQASPGACLGALASVLGPVLAWLRGICGALCLLLGLSGLGAGWTILAGRPRLLARGVLLVFAGAWCLVGLTACWSAMAPQADLALSGTIAVSAAAAALLHVPLRAWSRGRLPPELEPSAHA